MRNITVGEALDETTILLVNDNSDHLKLMSMVLEKASYKVIALESGRKAFDVARRERIDLVVSDVMMPDGDGIELCRMIRSHPPLASTPILLVSALRKDTGTVIEGLRSGADGYLEIPYDPLHLIATVARLIERKRVEDRIRRLNEELEVRVRERTAQLEAANKYLENEVNERKRMEIELHQMRDVAIESARLKSEFLANMSHEVRTPMNAVIGMAGLLLNTALSPRQRELAAAIETSADALLLVINDILDFSKIEAGKLRLDKIDFDLRDTIENSIYIFGEKAQSKTLRLDALVDQDVPTLLRGDPGRVRQVLTNLVSNAVKFTKEGEVIVRVLNQSESEKDVTLRLEVRDTGIGISESALKRLFRPFTQADGSTTRAYGGTGLGLAISKQLVDLMGGEIGVDSAKGAGSNFWFTARFEKQLPSKRIKRSPLAGIRIMIVDQDRAIRDAILQQCVTWRMLPTPVDTGVRALEILREGESRGQPFDVAIIDSQLPGTGGIELARAIKYDPRISGTKLVVVSPVALPPQEETEYEQLVAACLGKPMRRQQLHDILVGLIDTPGMMKSLALGTLDVLPEQNGKKKGTILVAEDNAVSQQMMSYLIEDLGYNVEIVSNGAQAVEALANDRYNLVLMDCQMPEVDGFTAVGQIRKTEGTRRHTPIVALTADAMRGTREKCLQSGMDDYLSKPFKRIDLERIINRWAGNIPGSVEPEDPPVLESLAFQPGDDDVIELSLVEQLRTFRSDADGDRLSELIDFFLSDTSARQATLLEAHTKGDAKKLKRQAHALKGSCGFFGANGLSKLCASLIEQATPESMDEAGKTVALIEKEFVKVKRRLEGWRDSELQRVAET
jgi:two-component system sensor histidine kinase/response regulator